jgi:hypothetical protein
MIGGTQPKAVGDGWLRPGLNILRKKYDAYCNPGHKIMNTKNSVPLSPGETQVGAPRTAHEYQHAKGRTKMSAASYLVTNLVLTRLMELLGWSRHHFLRLF